MLEIFQTLLFCPFSASLSGVPGQISPFWKYHQPHWVQRLGAGQEALVHFFELLQPMLQPWFVLYPIACHEYEPIKHHPWAYYRNVLQGFLQDDVYVSMHFIGICYPPKIEPVRVQLMVRNQDQPLRESGLQAPIFGTQQLPSNTPISADPDYRGTEPLSESNDE